MEEDPVLRLLTGCESVGGAFDASFERLRSAKTTLTDEISRFVAAKREALQETSASGEMLINAGGVLFPVSRSALQLIKRRYIAVLLLCFPDALPRDEGGQFYLEVSPAYFEAFLDGLTLYETNRTDTVQLPASKASDPAYNEYHALFMRTLSSFPALPQEGSGAVTPNLDGTACDGKDKAIADVVEESLGELERLMKRLTKGREELSGFFSAMQPFMKGQDDGDVEVLSLEVLGKKVSMLKRTLQRLGSDHPLLTRFSNTPPCWGDRRVRQTPTRHFVNTVDFARRIGGTMPAGQFVRPPAMEESECGLFKEDLMMYGLSYSYSPPVDLPAGNEWIIKSADEWVAVLDMIHKPICKPSLALKSSSDGFEYKSFLDKVAGKSGLLFAVKDRTHRFGCFVDGPLTPPQDPTKTSGIYRVPIFFFSLPTTGPPLSGAYKRTTKIELPSESQVVEVAGTSGVVKSDKGEPRGNVAIARGGAGGVLWLGYGDLGPAADLSRCQQWMAKKHLPAGYTGGYTGEDHGILAEYLNFTCSELEVWHVETGSRGCRSNAAAAHPALGGRPRKRWSFMSCLPLRGGK